MIEVMLFLSITGLLLVGVLGGTYASIATQRYNDSVRSFAEYLRQIYGEVISPETQGGGNSDDFAIYGKVAVFGLNSQNSADDEDIDNTIYMATLVGDVHINGTNADFIAELQSVHARIYCGVMQSAGNPEDTESTLSSYVPLWNSKLRGIDKKPFTGTVIISRAPSSGMVHTAYTEETFNIRDECEPGNDAASTAFSSYLAANPGNFSATSDIDFCIWSNNSTVVRDIRLAPDGRNTSAVSIIEDNPGESRCSR